MSAFNLAAQSGYICISTPNILRWLGSNCQETGMSDLNLVVTFIRCHKYGF